jgi:hypothetical protein
VLRRPGRQLPPLPPGRSGAAPLGAGRRGVRFAVAHDVGQVRDLLSRVRSESQLRTDPTARAVVTALTRSS